MTDLHYRRTPFLNTNKRLADAFFPKLPWDVRIHCGSKVVFLLEGKDKIEVFLLTVF